MRTPFIILTVLRFCYLAAISQTITNEGQTHGIQKIAGAMVVDSSFRLPIRPITKWPFQNTNIPAIGFLQINPIDSQLYYGRRDTTWLRILSNIDTLFIQAQTKVFNYYGTIVHHKDSVEIDTTELATINYIIRKQYATLSALSDTATNIRSAIPTITPYTNGYGLLLSGFQFKVDTTSTPTQFRIDSTSKNIRDYVTAQGFGTGSVTNVTTGFGLTGGPITTSGTLRVDSTNVTTQFRIDSAVKNTRNFVLGKGYGTGSVTSVGSGFGLSGGAITTTGTLLVDSTNIPTQFRIDSAVKNTRNFVLGKGYGTGSVTSVASGYGLTGGAITTTGTLKIDTSATPTQFRVDTASKNVRAWTYGVLPQIYNSAGLLSIVPKVWTGIITPTTGSGQTVDISSAGFSTILNVQAQAASNTSTIASVPFVSIKSYTTTQVIINIVQSNSNIVAILTGLVFATSFTGMTVHVTVFGY